jgi:hypothetical protein
VLRCTTKRIKATFERPNVRASCSMFSQILKLIPRLEFEALVAKTGAE